MAKTLAEFEKEEKEVKEVVEEQVKEEVKTEEELVKKDPAVEGEDTVKEDMVIIGGKPRPLKNYEAELKRKHEEEIERVREELRTPRETPKAEPDNSWLNNVYQMAENEIAQTGKAVPLQTIMQIANSISQKNLEATFKTREQGEKTIKSFKRNIRKEPDFAELEDDFDGLVEQLRPDQINSATLEVILNSVRGKRLPELLKKVQSKTRIETEKDTQILNEPTITTGGSAKPKTSLSAIQIADLDRMNKDSTMEWTEKEYNEALKKKQERFKAMGAKNIPQTLSDLPIK